jgi:hypothetical protein
MIDGTHRVEFDDVHVIGANDLVMLCQIRNHIVEVSPHHLLPGTTISGQGDRGRLVLAPPLAIKLGLV